jgi:tetratricopeptide (TPR) repeat protein
MRTLLVCFALCAATWVIAPPGAAAEWPPESLVNIQALPEDISVRKLRDMMRGFAGSLGVRCNYCHVGDDPNDLTSIDFTSDEKVEKRKAREMIRMVQRINGELLAKVPERSDPPVVVTCRTCHHSLTRPVEIRDVLVKTFESEGVDATIAKYQELRKEYYGSDSYDFRHFMLANVAEEVASENPEGAIQLLEFNGKLHPTSGQTFSTMAKIYREIDDIDSAIRSLERALETDPENEFYRRVLQRLREQR